MNIQDLLEGQALVPAQLQELNIEVQGLSLNTNTIEPGFVFFAFKGHTQDGRAYLQTAIEKGACALVVESLGCEAFELCLSAPIPVIKVEALNEKLSAIAGRYYGNPSQDLMVIGITGTNGKTTCAHLLSSALTNLGIPCAMMGTLTHNLTTPDAITVQSQLATFKKSGLKAVAMEVSSHGLDQHRVAGVHFRSAIFTNLTQDHLDYHLSMESYGRAKQKLFAFKSLERIILNADDPFVSTLLQQDVACPVILYSREPNILVDTQKNYLTISTTNIQLSTQGLKAKIHTPWGEENLYSKLLGDFNLSNILSVLAELCSQNIPLKEAIKSIGVLLAPPGRMQQFGGESNPIVLVDFSHTPDALHQALKVARQYCTKKLWCVFGCGGERDKLKRPKMGYIASSLADEIIITSDNPRHEPIDEIMKDILKGIPLVGPNIKVENDRAKAIEYAIANATSQDVILIAGKGHEAYQIIGDHSFMYSDANCVQMCFSQKA